jgi:O-antigen/teichoic acid export membrane protein
MSEGRARRILLSYVTTGFAKTAAAGVQLLGLPVVAATLGAQRFGAMLVLAALASFCCMPAQGLPSSVSYGIAGARAAGDDEQLRAEFWSAVILVASLGLPILLILSAVSWLVDPVTLLGSGATAFREEARLGLASVVLFVAATYFFSWVEGLRGGFEEYHLTNLFTLLASFAALAGIGLAWAFAPTIALFYVATFAVYPLLQGLNLLLFLRSRRRLVGRPTLTRGVLRETALRAYGYSRAQLGLVIHLQGTVYLAAQGFGLAAGALTGGLVRLFYIVHNFLLSILNPILPTLRYGAAAGDHDWVRRTLSASMTAILALLAIMAAAIALLGDRIVQTWLSLQPPAAPMLFAAFAAMALFYIGAQLAFLVLLSLGDPQWPSRRLLWAGICGTAAGFVVVRLGGGLLGLIAAQAISMLALAFVPIAIRLLRRARRLEGAEA